MKLVEQNSQVPLMTMKEIKREGEREKKGRRRRKKTLKGHLIEE